MNQTVLFGERLRELRTTNGLNQTDFAKLCGVTKKTQMLYEAGERVPDAAYLLAMEENGFSALYFLTGKRDWFTEGDVSEELDPEEQKLIKAFRNVPEVWRGIAMGVLMNAEKQLRSQRPTPVSSSESVEDKGAE